MDVLGLTRLRDCPDYDDLTDAEHVAVLDARELLDELRPQGYCVTLARTGTLRVVPPAGADKEVRSRIAALAPALAYVLRLERWTDPLPDACRACAGGAADRCGTGRESVIPASLVPGKMALPNRRTPA